MTENTPKDPSLTLEVNNDEIESMMERYAKAQSNEERVETLNKLVGLFHRGRVLTPAAEGENKKPATVLISNKAGQSFLPIFTSKKHLAGRVMTPIIMNIPYLAANEMALRDGLNCSGIAINPYTDNLIFRKELLEKINAVEQKRKANATEGAPAGQRVQMSEKEYMMYELRQFCNVYLPKLLFAQGQQCVDDLCKDKENALDGWFEDAYQNKRLYPYLPEEFGVMPMDVSEEQLFIRIDMPTRDAGPGSCDRIYIAWDKEQEIGRYFGIQRADRQFELVEITSELRPVSHGEAPGEGTELQTIMELTKTGL